MRAGAVSPTLEALHPEESFFPHRSPVDRALSFRRARCSSCLSRARSPPHRPPVPASRFAYLSSSFVAVSTLSLHPRSFSSFLSRILIRLLWRYAVSGFAAVAAGLSVGSGECLLAPLRVPAFNSAIPPPFRVDCCPILFMFTLLLQGMVRDVGTVVTTSLRKVRCFQPPPCPCCVARRRGLSLARRRRRRRHRRPDDRRAATRAAPARSVCLLALTCCHGFVEHCSRCLSVALSPA